MAKILCILSALTLLVIPTSARAQDRGFPRTVIDMSGAAVTIPRQPDVVSITSSDDPILARLAVRRIRSGA